VILRVPSRLIEGVGSHLEVSRSHLLVGGLLLLGILARTVALLQNPSLIGDEAMLALNIGHRSFMQLLQPLDYSPVATIPFLWTERLATLPAGVSGYALRIIPLVAGVGLLWILYRLTYELLGRLEAIVALALAATSFPLIRYSVEVKPYIVDALVCALLITTAVRLAANLDDHRRWSWLAIGGAIGVLVSTPALLVCAAAGAALAIAGLRAGRLHVLPRLALLMVLWGGIFAFAYMNWYAPVADSPYMRHFWAPTFLRPGTPPLSDRLRFAVSETGCTLTCWRGMLDLSPVLMLLAALGLAVLWRRRGSVYAILVVGPLAAASGASAMGRYPMATRLLLFTTPLLCIMVAGGIVWVASEIERRWTQVKARWVLFLFLYPSLIVAATLTFAPPADWGVQSVEVSPLAEDFYLHSHGQPVYVDARSVPAWVFHTTDWSSPDTSRLAFAAWAAGPEGPGFVNAPSRGKRGPGEGKELAYQTGCWLELYGTSTGSQDRPLVGHVPSRPDSGWAESEAWRIRDAARPFIWILLSDFEHGGIDERQILIEAVERSGGHVIYSRSTADAVLYRVQF
jgi:hypothetical protein